MDILHIVVVVVVLIAALWIIYYVPMPPGSPVWIKNVLYIVLILVAFLFLIGGMGGFHLGR